MLIKKLTLKNFKQFKEMTVDSFPHGLIGLVGKNGAGKSTIFEAIYYSLFGKPLSGAIGHLRNDHSENEPVSVIMEFEEKGELYRVIRGMRGKSNAPDASLHINKPELGAHHFELLAETSTPVNREIYKILRIDANSFKNSFFAQQKETAGIISGTPAKREESFKKMLGFDKYDDLVNKITIYIKSYEAEAEAIKKYLIGDEVVAENKEKIAALEISLAAIKVSLEDLTKQAEVKRKEKDLQAEKVNKLEEIRIKFTELGKKITKNETSIANSKEHIEKLIQEIARLEQIAADINLKSKVVDEYKKINTEIEGLNHEKNKKIQFDEINKGLEKARSSRNKTNSEFEVESKELEKLPDYASKINTKENLLSEKKEHISTQRERENELQASIQSISDELKTKQKRLEKVVKLGADGNCPECERPLREHQPKLVEKYESEIKALLTKKRVLDEKYQDASAQRKTKESEIEDVENNLKELRQKLALKEQKSLLIEEKQKKIAEFDAQIQTAELDIAALGEIKFDQKMLDKAQERLAEIKLRYDKYQKMLGEVKALDKTKSSKSDEENKLKEYETELKNLQKEQNSLSFSEESLKAEKEALVKISDIVEDLTDSIHKIELEISETNSNMKQLNESLEQDAKKRVEHKAKLKDINDFKVFKEVIADYRTKMITNAIPHVAIEADKLFAELTGGRYAGLEITNDLEININREGRTVPLSTLSGGEKDLAAICLRVAISREIVNSLSGGKIGFLAFDEVFGAQDEERRELLLQALQQLSEHFKQVFVVSHNGDVEAELPNRVSIMKRGKFSVIDKIIDNN
ncbi:MAG: SMC family ATPase [Ignavibacteriales bacterium]|nr:MAG: SMC family ATPase [Ignavibacteriaceae bacterium]MBW7872715.1 SMC family ATPase [Ignavibacteria bacterium]MCZ2143435.1 SMC family ATPase [Ignavibacteriales bacterium]MBV6444313.1 Chromosome partition protein Smc [Ignavibacteriaceae bacterium]MBZ0196798.1 SMC family ATPase [Ignavibacteriaceae bacterium]